MPKPEIQMVPCLHCTRGPKARKDCAAGMGARSLSPGCFLGAYLPGKAPKSIKVGRFQNGDLVQVQEAVHYVEAPSYGDACRIATEMHYPQWIWVKDGIPGESR